MTDSRPPQTLAELRRVLRSGQHLTLDPASVRSLVGRLPDALPPLEELERSVRSLADELREIVTTHDAAGLILALERRIDMYRMTSTHDVVPEVFDWDAKLEYLQGLALSSERGSVAFDTPEIEQTAALVDQLFELQQFAILVSRAETSDAADGVSLTAYMLAIEHLIDRMQGYTEHLELISRSVFDPIREDCIETFGFNPADVTHVVRQMVRKANEDINDGRDLMFELMSDPDSPEPEALDPDIRIRIQRGLQTLLDPPVWTAEAVSEISRVSVEEAAGLLDSMSLDWPCQPDFLLPSDQNLARTYPIVRLDSEEFWVPRVWDLLHGLVAWFTHELRARELDELKEKFLRSRDRTAEGVVRKALESVFGRSNVHANQHFDHVDGHGEIDCLVASSATPLVAESKAASLTEAGRRGAPARVARVGDSIIRVAFDQLSHAYDYINAGGRSFASTEGGTLTQRIDDYVSSPVAILVTFERMDPIASQATAFRPDSELQSVWVVSLADFLMVRDVLSNPAEFLSYAVRRASLASTEVQTYMESDLLGLFLKDRLAELTEPTTTGSAEMRLVGYASTEVNRYFTEREMGVPEEEIAPISSGVPLPVLSSLATLLGVPFWSSAALAVMGVPPERWKAWSKKIRRQLRRRRSAERFEFRDQQLAIVADVAEATISRVGDEVEVVVDLSGFGPSDLL